MTAISRRYTNLKRLVAVGPMAAQEREVDRLIRDGWTIKRSGRKSIAPGRYDVTKFKVIATKEIKDEPRQTTQGKRTNGKDSSSAEAR